MPTEFHLPSAEEKPTYVRDMFDAIAGGYDSANDWMTGGLHRLWKRQMVAKLAPRTGESALDLATGTGDLAVLLAHAVGPTGQVHGLDFSEGMLNLARQRTDAPDVTWLQGDMLALPFPDASMDVVTVGFGLRNVADLDQALSEIRRVLKPGGRFGSLEMGHPRFAPIRWGVSTFNATIVPLVGKLASGHAAPYKYLHASSLAFVSQDELAERCRKAGLQDLSVRDVAFGALAIVTGMVR